MNPRQPANILRDLDEYRTEDLRQVIMLLKRSCGHVAIAIHSGGCQIMRRDLHGIFAVGMHVDVCTCTPAVLRFGAHA